jgi:FKBP12-rapamycin complex-associated protein
MEVLRANKESLMAVLEAFAYDPLIAWRLIPTNNPGGAPEPRNDDPAYVPQRRGRPDETEILNGA